MAKKNKYYVVWQGHEPGIYDSWPKCQAQIKGYPNAKYKGFPSREAAEAAYHDMPESHFRKDRKAPPGGMDQDAYEQVEWESISVDAACSGNPGLMEYRGVDTRNKTELFRVGPLPDGTNNIGEFLALVHALALLKREGKSSLPIYSDSRTARAWVRNKRVKTNLKKTARNHRIFDLIDRAIVWLKENKFENPILIWDTKNWGEIPADFGRK